MSTAISTRQKAALERLDKDRAGRHRAEPEIGRVLAELVERPNCGGFDLTTLWGVDTEIAADMVTVFALVANCHHYPDDLGYDEEFQTKSSTLGVRH